MKGYLISLLGIVLISVLAEIILPAGQTAKYIKGIISIFVVYILINPIVLFLKKDFNISSYLVSDSAKIDQVLLKNMYQDQIKAKQTDLENLLEEKGYCNVKIVFNYAIVENNLILKNVSINLADLVITENNSNINKYQYIRQVVLENVALKEEEVVFE